MDHLINVLATAIGGPAVRIWPLYLPGMIILAYLVWRREKHGGSFVGWLFPARTYLHKSHLVDLQLFLFGRVLSLIGLFQKIAVTAAVATGVISVFGDQISANLALSPVLIGLLLVCSNDFATYWIHRIHHEHPTLWPFHAVHHSAEVMTPITVYRKHPLYDIFSALVKGVVLGLVQGLLLSLLVQDLSIPLALGVNAFYFAFNAFAANLRHSHVWLSFGFYWEHLFISPAQHQVHHSIERKHFNKNYGEMFAIWDWMFGTLYICDAKEDISFGLGDAQGKRICQPHHSLKAALVVPLKQSWKSLARQRRARTATAGEDQATAPLAGRVE